MLFQWWNFYQIGITVIIGFIFRSLNTRILHLSGLQKYRRNLEYSQQISNNPSILTLENESNSINLQLELSAFSGHICRGPVRFNNCSNTAVNKYQLHQYTTGVLRGLQPLCKIWFSVSVKSSFIAMNVVYIVFCKELVEKILVWYVIKGLTSTKEAPLTSFHKRIANIVLPIVTLQCIRDFCTASLLFTYVIKKTYCLHGIFSTPHICTVLANMMGEV